MKNVWLVLSNVGKIYLKLNKTHFLFHWKIIYFDWFFMNRLPYPIRFAYYLKIQLKKKSISPNCSSIFFYFMNNLVKQLLLRFLNFYFWEVNFIVSFIEKHFIPLRYFWELNFLPIGQICHFLFLFSFSETSKQLPLYLFIYF